MSYNYPFSRRRGSVRPRSTGSPGVAIEEVQRLAQAYRTLQAQAEQQAQTLEALRREHADLTRQLAQARQELEIKSEALRRQSADFKHVEAELMWTRAALQQQERQEQASPTASAAASTAASTAESTAEAMSWRERFLRLQEELDALRRRWEQRFAGETAAARQEILRDMLPLADHLELAIQHGATLTGAQAAEYVRNIGATHQAFLHALKRYGVTPLEAVGQPFDPAMHEAVGQVDAGDMPSGSVLQVVQTGYMDGEKLLRPARVLVRA